jgi:hypothetical protein
MILRIKKKDLREFGLISLCMQGKTRYKLRQCKHCRTEQFVHAKYVAKKDKSYYALNSSMYDMILRIKTR